MPVEVTLVLLNNLWGCLCDSHAGALSSKTSRHESWAPCSGGRHGRSPEGAGGSAAALHCFWTEWEINTSIPGIMSKTGSWSMQRNPLEHPGKCVCVLVAQSCPTLWDPTDYSPPGSSVHGVFQAWVLGWVAIPFSRGSSPPRDQAQVSCIAGRFFTIWTFLDSYICSNKNKIFSDKEIWFPISALLITSHMILNKLLNLPSFTSLIFNMRYYTYFIGFCLSKGLAHIKNSTRVLACFLLCTIKICTWII